MEWRSLADNWLLQPQSPKGIVHFLGGAFVGATPHIVYDALLSSLAKAGYLVVATSYVTDPNHRRIASQIASDFQTVLAALSTAQDLPIFGLGHSLGCKLHILNSCQEVTIPSPSRRAGNILMAYSNASFRGDLPKWVPVEFQPSPEETEALIDRYYALNRTLLVKFERDSIDDIAALNRQLAQKLGSPLDYQLMPGDHGTCAGGRYPLPTSQAFSPLDAIGQYLYQSLTQENQMLHSVVCMWLDRQLQLLRSTVD